MKKRSLFPYNLQFFAEGEGDGSGSGNDDTGNDTHEGDGSGSGDDGSSGKQDEKKFSQADVTRMMAKEKREGKKSVLNSLGFKSEDEAKNAVKLLNTLLDSQKTPEDKANDKAKGAEAEKDEAVRRAEAAESKLACVMAGVSKEAVDDVLAIALLKVSDEKPLDKVLEDMKKEKRYASFFGEGDDSGSGTGSDPGHNKKTGNETKGGFGKEVAEAFSGTKQKKSSFFKEA